MPNLNSRNPRPMNGLLIELGEPFRGPVPSIIVFQYNAEKIDRDMTPWSAEAHGGGTYCQASIA